jgi:flagellar protein FlgJ
VSISPPSDILLGVAHAADPQKYRAAVNKLARASGASPSEAESALQAAIGEAVSSAPVKFAAKAIGTDPSGRIHSAFAHDAVGRAKKDPNKDFEAFFLQTAIQSMLPKEGKALFGTGPAGEIWKSILAEQIARELSQSTSFGIAEQIAEHAKTKKKDSGEAAAAAGLAPDHAGPEQLGGTARITELRRLLSAEGQIALGAPLPWRQQTIGSG